MMNTERIVFHMILFSIAIIAVLGSVFPGINQVMTVLALLGMGAFLLAYLVRLGHEIYDYGNRRYREAEHVSDTRNT